MMLISFLLATAVAAPERLIVIGDTVSAHINGAPVQLRVDPAGTAMPLLDRAAADRAKLKPSMLAIAYAVGPQRVTGYSAVAPVDLGAGAAKLRVGWTDRRYATPVEGTIGPGGLPDAVIRFQLRAPLPNERIFTLPMTGQGGLWQKWGERFAMIDVGGAPMRVRFDPYHRRTLATAGAAVRLATAQNGAMTGKTGPAEIAFGIERPVRDMVLGTPLQVGPFSLSSLGVRMGDFGSTAGLREIRSIDPDEVIVTAKRHHDPHRDLINIGSDQLDRCSSILFDNPHKLIALTCA
jgi:hypothetical protein